MGARGSSPPDGAAVRRRRRARAPPARPGFSASMVVSGLPRVPHGDQGDHNISVVHRVWFFFNCGYPRRYRTTRHPGGKSVHCPFCRHPDSRVIDSRVADDGAAIRSAVLLGVRAALHHAGVGHPMVAKRSGVTEPFTRDKIIRGVQRACQGRPVDEDQRDARPAGGGDDQVARTGRGAVHEVGLAILGPLARPRPGCLPQVRLGVPGASSRSMISKRPSRSCAAGGRPMTAASRPEGLARADAGARRPERGDGGNAQCIRTYGKAFKKTVPVRIPA